MSIKIKTGLRGQINKYILEGVQGQLSDGIWENSLAMHKYWTNIHIVEDEDGELCLEVPNNFYAIWDMKNDTKEVKKWYARKIKKVVMIYLSYEPFIRGCWSHTCNIMVDYFHGDYSTRTYPTIAQAYVAYETLHERM